MRGTVLQKSIQKTGTHRQALPGRVRKITTPQCHAKGQTNSPNVGLVESVAKGCASALLAAAVLAAPMAVAPPQLMPQAQARLTAGDPIKNAKAILRYALPVDNRAIREVQGQLEGISEQLRIPGNKLGGVSRAVRNAAGIVTNRKADIVKDLAPDRRAEGLAALDALDKSLNDFQRIIDAGDKEAVPAAQQLALSYVGQVEEAMIGGFPFSVPPEYASRPLLMGRATLEMVTEVRETPEGPLELPMTLVLDGYNAPVSAGQFFDLVQRGFYNGMEIQRADGFVVQTGDPDGPAEGFVDESGEVRRVPLEIRVQGDKEPVYDFSLEDLGRANDQPVLPFNAYGTLAWARNEFENDSASSQVFFLLKESELTPSSANLLDGRFAVFGYAVQGQDALGFMKVGDRIKYIKVVDGAENFKPKGVAAA